MYLFSWTHADEPLSAPKIIKFLPYPVLSDNVKNEPTSNLIPYPEKEYLSGSALMVNRATQIRI